MQLAWRRTLYSIFAALLTLSVLLGGCDGGDNGVLEGAGIEEGIGGEGSEEDEDSEDGEEGEDGEDGEEDEEDDD